jgi:hypothetical protein
MPGKTTARTVNVREEEEVAPQPAAAGSSS